MSKKALVFTIIAVVIVTGVLVVYKMWNKSFTDPRDARNPIKVTAQQLFADFNANENEAAKKYVPEKLGSKVVEVSGEIKELGKNESGETFYYLKTANEMSGVKCIMDKDSVLNAKEGASITIVGFCDGVKKDTLMDIPIMDIIVNRCKAIK